MAKTLYGDAFIEFAFKDVNYGSPEELHDIYDWAVKNGAKPLTLKHPLNVFKRVLDALDRDERFEKFYIRYDGICKNPVRHFKLKEVKNEDQTH